MLWHLVCSDRPPRLENAKTRIPGRGGGGHGRTRLVVDANVGRAERGGAERRRKNLAVKAKVEAYVALRKDLAKKTPPLKKARRSFMLVEIDGDQFHFQVISDQARRSIQAQCCGTGSRRRRECAAVHGDGAHAAGQKVGRDLIS